MGKTKVSARSLAAKKAWATKRAQQNEHAALLTKRALKAWKTRRANGWVHPAHRTSPNISRES